MPDLYPVPNHNGPEWLTVTSLDERPWGRGGSILWQPGFWYVIRVCPCHHLQPVSLGFETRQEAERAIMRTMLETSARLGT